MNRAVHPRLTALRERGGATEMKIPSLLYGSAPAVKLRCRKLAKKLKSDGNWSDFDPGPFLDTREVEGVIYLHTSRLIPPHQDNFHCYALSGAVFEMGPVHETMQRVDTWARGSLEEPWRFLGAQCTEIIDGFGRDRKLLKPLVEVAARFWPTLTAEGRRYGSMINVPHDVWYVLRAVHFALAHLGFSVQDINAKVQPDNLDGFLKRINDAETKP